MGTPASAAIALLLGCQPLTGHLPGFRQPALAADFVLPAAAPAQAVLERIDQRLAAACPPYAEGTNPGFLDAQPLLQRTVRLRHALLAQARCPLFGEGIVVARQREGSGAAARVRMRLALPVLGHDTPQMHALLDACASLVGTLAADAAAEVPARTLAHATQLAAAVAPRGFNSSGLLLAADQRNIPWTRLGQNIFQLGWGTRSRLLDSTFTDRTANVASRIAQFKTLTASTLRRAGLPVPQHAVARDAEQALAIARRLGWPVVVKPEDCEGGRGVSVNLRNEAALRRAFAVARAASPNVLVEQHVEGNDYRLQVHGDEVFWAVHRQPGGVAGDGERSVEELLAALNADPKRGTKGSGLVLQRIEMNDEARELLSEQGLTPASVPAAGRFVRLRLAANVGNGGTPVPVLPIAHPDNLALGVRATRLLRLDLAGVDVLMPDIARSWLETGAAIIEVNAQPQVSPQWHGWLVEHLVSGGGRIPVVGVVERGAALFERIAAAARERVRATPGAPGLGIAGAAGIELGGRRIAPAAGPVSAAQQLLADPACAALLVHLDTTRRPTRLLPVDRFDALVMAAAPPGAGPDLGGDWLAHAGALAAAGAQVFGRSAHPAWPAASAAWRQPVRELLDEDGLVQRCLVALLGAGGAGGASGTGNSGAATA